MQKQDLKSLQSKWYKKLKSSGFKDIENSDTGFLRVYDSEHFLKTKKRKNMADFQEYISRAESFLNEYIFDCLIEKRIWELHCLGLSSRETVRTLMQENIKVSDFLVKSRVRKLKDIMVDCIL